LKKIEVPASETTWLDVGCSVGHLCRIAHKKGFQVTGIDKDRQSLKIAKLLSSKEISYTQKVKKSKTFHIITAHSLLSVVNDKEQMLQELLNYKKEGSQLIIIEPTQNLSVSNVYKFINSPSSFWYYKGLLLWAFFRQGKAIDKELVTNHPI